MTDDNKRVLKRDALAAHDEWVEAVQVWGEASPEAWGKLAEYNRLRESWESANGRELTPD